MSANVPIISITAASNCRPVYEHHYTSTSSVSEDSTDTDMDYNQNIGGLTDVEDFDSSVGAERPRSRKSSKNDLVIPKDLVNPQSNLTDIEDYNDSDSDKKDDKSAVYPELKLSLHEFMRHDFQENLTTSNGMKITTEHKSGNFLQAQTLNATDDYLTDCEEYNTDSEIENNYEKSVCIDLKEASLEQGRVSIADLSLKIKRCADFDYDNTSSIVSDISGAALALSDIDGKEWQSMSDDEILELSNEAEVCQLSYSDSISKSNTDNISEDGLLSCASLPPIDVTFIHATNTSNLKSSPYVQGTSAKSGLGKDIFLRVERKRKEEVLTDTEHFYDSVAECEDDDSFDCDEDNQQPIPQAVIVSADDGGGITTDCDDVSEIAISAQESVPSVDLNVIPLPQREVVILQEDKFGDTISSVMPMEKEYQFGLYAATRDECLTESEEYSCTDDLEAVPILLPSLHSRSPSPSPHMLVEPDITIANESLKTQQSKRLEIIYNTEAVTDVEEFYIVGTNSRKKKFKSRTASKSKSKFLETPKPDAKEDVGGTDIEDMDLSDGRLLPTFKDAKSIKINPEANHSPIGKITDVEDMTADDLSSVSDVDLPLIDTNTTNFKDYESSSKNIVVTLETCGSATYVNNSSYRNPNNDVFLRESWLNTNQNLPQPQTEIEDVQLPSDTEEWTNFSAPTDDCVCHELNEILNESCTIVHEKCSNSFNIDAEKLHIKGMLRECNTDIEYVESDESAARSSK